MFRRGLPIAVVMLGLAIAGCANEAGPGLLVEKVVALDMDCVADPENPVALQSSLYDVNPLSGAYKVWPVYRSQLVGRMENNPLRGEPNGMYVTGAEVSLLDDTGALIDFIDLPNPFTVPSYVFVDPGGKSAGAIEAIPDLYRQVLFDNGFGAGGVRTPMYVEFEPFAMTIGGIEVDGTVFRHRVLTCQGCRAVCPSDAASDEELALCGGGYDNSLYVDPAALCRPSM